MDANLNKAKLEQAARNTFARIYASKRAFVTGKRRGAIGQQTEHQPGKLALKADQNSLLAYSLS
jgi:hypothetical protein